MLGDRQHLTSGDVLAMSGHRWMNTKLVAVLVSSLFLGGCAGLIFSLVGAATSVVGVYQRYEDRQAQKDQTEEILRLREAVEQHQQEIRQLSEVLRERSERDK